MGRNFKSLLLGVLLFGFIGWGVNFLDKNSNQAPKLLTAQISPNELSETRLILKPDADELELSAKAAVLFFFDDNGGEQTLFDKDAQIPLPIASLTKLMAALVIAENYSLGQIIEISDEAAGKPGNGSGQLKIGDKFLMLDLFKVMLIESNNSAAMALAQQKGIDTFVGLMNRKADDLNLTSMNFVNSTGLDTHNESGINESSAFDLAKLAAFLLQKEPHIFEISLLKEFELRDVEGALNHTAENTNILLGKMDLIVGGKTGETPKSGGCLLLIVRAPKNQGYLIGVILNSPDRFSEMEKLINWTRESYEW